MDARASRLSGEGDTSVNEALHRILIMPKRPLGEDRLGIRGRGESQAALRIVGFCTGGFYQSQRAEIHRGRQLHVLCTCMGLFSCLFPEQHRVTSIYIALASVWYYTRNDLKPTGGWVGVLCKHHTQGHL